MFTGIVEEQGTVGGIRVKANLLELTIAAKKVLTSTKIGDSIAVDGICLTVVSKKNGSFTVEVMKETMNKTTVKLFKNGQKVNLERSLKANSRISGHFVQGHIDTMGKITNRIKRKNDICYEIAVEKNILPFIVNKGSISIDGISLTVGRVHSQGFSVYLIPHTLKMTSLADKKIGDFVNIETDILAKYLLRSKVIARSETTKQS